MTRDAIPPFPCSRDQCTRPDPECSCVPNAKSPFFRCRKIVTLQRRSPPWYAVANDSRKRKHNATHARLFRETCEKKMAVNGSNAPNPGRLERAAKLNRSSVVKRKNERASPLSGIDQRTWRMPGSIQRILVRLAQAATGADAAQRKNLYGVGRFAARCVGPRAEIHVPC
jgi:hypothetical protein